MHYSNSMRFLFLLFMLTLPLAVNAQRKDSEFFAWSVHHTHQGSQKVCYTISHPLYFEGNVSFRQAAYVMVSFNPDAERWEINIGSGFPYRPLNPGSLQVDGGELFPIFATEGTPDRAWVPTIQTERNAFTALKEGTKDIVISGFRQDGTAMQDVYTLKGFADALERVEELCNVNPTP